MTRAASLFLITSAALWGAEKDMAQMVTTVASQKISYQLVNQTAYTIVSYELMTDFTSGGYEALGCGIGVTVKPSADLFLERVCSLPTDPATGKPVTFTARITEVRFSNGLIWKPSDR